MARIGFMTSEEMSFENVDNDDGRTTDACLYYKLTYEPLAQVELITTNAILRQYMGPRLTKGTLQHLALY